MPAIDTEDLFKDIFMPIARDGVHIMEVGIRLQKAYASLAAIGDEKCKAIAKLHSALILKRALAALTLQEDKDLMESNALV